jgi:hypothetical protein
VDLKREIAYTRQDARLAESCAGGAHAGDLSHLTSPASFGLKKTVAFFAFPASLALKIVLFLFLFFLSDVLLFRRDQDSTCGLRGG